MPFLLEFRVQGLGSPVVPFPPFYSGVSLLKLNIRQRLPLSLGGLLGNLAKLTADLIRTSLPFKLMLQNEWAPQL